MLDPCPAGWQVAGGAWRSWWQGRAGLIHRRVLDV